MTCDLMRAFVSDLARFDAIGLLGGADADFSRCLMEVSDARLDTPPSATFNEHVEAQRNGIDV